MEETRNHRKMLVHFIPTQGTEKDLAKAAILSAVPDHSPESCAIFSTAFGITREIQLPKDCHLIAPFSQDTLSGIDLKNRRIRKGRLDKIEEWLAQCGGVTHQGIREIVTEVESRGNQAFVVADQETDLGVIEILN
jgi:high-affinity K+ transport system ATPase subunit B